MSTKILQSRPAPADTLDDLIRVLTALRQTVPGETPVYGSERLHLNPVCIAAMAISKRGQPKIVHTRGRQGIVLFTGS